MSLETSRPRSVFGGYPIDAAPVARNSQRNEPDRYGPSNRHQRYWDAVREYSVAMSGSAATRDESRDQPWDSFSVLGRRCARAQMMVSSTTGARVGFWGREPSVGSQAVAAG
jgi:hypothetical protein